MSDSKGGAAGGGIGISSTIGVVFIILKLCKVIAWPWLWVLCPFWIPLAVIVLVIGILALVTVVSKRGSI